MKDKEIWIRFCEGDEASFKELYNQYYAILFAWGCKWADGNTEFVRDCLHDFFLYLWEKKAGLSKDIHVSNYLLTSFKRTLFAQQKKSE